MLDPGQEKHFLWTLQNVQSLWSEMTKKVWAHIKAAHLKHISRTDGWNLSLRASTVQLLSPDRLIRTLKYPQTAKNTASSHSVRFLSTRFVNAAWRRSLLEKPLISLMQKAMMSRTLWLVASSAFLLENLTWWRCCLKSCGDTKGRNSHCSWRATLFLRF